MFKTLRSCIPCLDSGSSTEPTPASTPQRTPSPDVNSPAQHPSVPTSNTGANTPQLPSIPFSRSGSADFLARSGELSLSASRHNTAAHTSRSSSLTSLHRLRLESSIRLQEETLPEEPAVMPTLERVISAPAETGPALQAQSASHPGLTDMPPLKYRGKELMDRAKATDFFRYVERDGFVRMKSQDEYPGGGRGVDPKVVYPRTACTEVNFPELGYDPRVKDYAVLVKQDDGTWLARDAKTGEETRPIDGKRYNFATMPDGTIRIGTEPHPKLSGFAPYLKYAGEVVFQAGKEVEGIGQSGTYVPPLDKGEELSGFNCKFTTQL